MLWNISHEKEDNFAIYDWIDLEGIKLSERRQKKDKHCIELFICEIYVSQTQE